MVGKPQSMLRKLDLKMACDVVQPRIPHPSLKKLWIRVLEMKMKCGCINSSSVSYDQLTNGISFPDLTEDKDLSTEKQVEVAFYNDDGSYQTVVVEKNLRASDLCQILALKNRVGLDINWTVVEHWVDVGLERSLEDHEDVFLAHREMEMYPLRSAKRFVFRKDFRKYEFFRNPQQFFPADMMDLSNHNDFLLSKSNSSILHNFLSTLDDCPAIFSQIWLREPHKHVWAKAFLLLKGNKLYMSYKVQVVAKFLRHWNSSVNCLLNINRQSESPPQVHEVEDWGQLQLLAELSDYAVYVSLNAKNQLRAPTEFGLCLRPNRVRAHSAPSTPPTPGAADNTEGLLCLACESERIRTCWATAMRLAKYGKQLRKNYLAFRNKQDPINSKEYNRYTVPNESVRSRVAMDFTGSVGRIVEDPKEAKAIAVAEGNSWRRRWRTNPRPSVSRSGSGLGQALEPGIHVTQPWFHSGMSRDHAAQLIQTYGTVDGVFLVRESRSSPGSFVLTFKCGSKVIHSHIQPVRVNNTIDPSSEAVCFSLDNGATKFYDLLQLVEFYQLNAGCLPTRLTHYIVQSSAGPRYSDKSSTESF
nr:PREDICTED: growth factor receptor-bound protein 14-like isoform X2 [Bemisia tabaci]